MAMRGQKPKHTARLQKMTRYRLRIQEFSLLIRSTLHSTIIPNNNDQPSDRHTELFRTLLARFRQRPRRPRPRRSRSIARSLPSGPSSL